MTSRSPSSALRTYIYRIEQAFQLLGPLSVSARPNSINTGRVAVISHDTLVARIHERDFLSPVPLRNQEGAIELFLIPSITYSIEPILGTPSSWTVRQSGYMYAITDCLERAIVSFHFHPAGRSWHTGFHAHAEAAAPLFLHRLGNADDKTREIFSHKVHIPTSEIQVEDLVELLHKDFGVRLTERDPQRVVRVLSSIRAARRLEQRDERTDEEHD